MKVAILTQALQSNYGGILQNYAMQEVLRQMGHQAITVDRHHDKTSNLFKEIAKYFLQITKPSFDSSVLTTKQKERLFRNQESFINNHIYRTKIITSQREFDEFISSELFNAYVVGSDQCWRPVYSPNIFNYFLDFLSDDSSAKRIAYAASFGVDNWEFNKDQTERVSSLAKRFDAISVREKSAVELCDKYLSIKPAWVLDPTMLLGREGFLRFIQPVADSHYLLNYFLETSPANAEICASIKESMHLTSIVNNLKSNTFHRGQRLRDCENLSVERWLSNIYYSDFVTTDSFHGAVFSILFNKPFIVRLNKVRGNARLESLLSDFDLTDCIVNAVRDLRRLDFNWDRINHHLEKRRAESLAFLRDALKA